MFDLTQFVDVPLLAFLLIIGKIIKSSKLCDKIPNRFITIIVPAIAVIYKLATAGISLESFDYGVCTGLCAIGTHQVGKQIFVNNPIKMEEDDLEEDYHERSNQQDEEDIETIEDDRDLSVVGCPKTDEDED